MPIFLERRYQGDPCTHLSVCSASLSLSSPNPGPHPVHALSGAQVSLREPGAPAPRARSFWGSASARPSGRPLLTTGSSRCHPPLRLSARPAAPPSHARARAHGLCGSGQSSRPERGGSGDPEAACSPGREEAAREERGRCLRTPLPARLRARREGGTGINTFDFEAKVNGNCHPGRLGHWAPRPRQARQGDGRAPLIGWRSWHPPTAAPPPDWMRRSDDSLGPIGDARGAALLFSGTNSRGGGLTSPPSAPEALCTRWPRGTWRAPWASWGGEAGTRPGSAGHPSLSPRGSPPGPADRAVKPTRSVRRSRRRESSRNPTRTLALGRACDVVAARGGTAHQALVGCACLVWQERNHPPQPRALHAVGATSDPGVLKHHSAQPLAFGRGKQRPGTCGAYVPRSPRSPKSPKSSVTAALEAGSRWPGRVSCPQTFGKNFLSCPLIGSAPLCQNSSKGASNSQLPLAGCPRELLRNRLWDGG